jgi:hypothetical protein
MPELKLYMPTYNHGKFRTTEPSEDLPEFGEPRVPVVVRNADGVRIVLGSHDYWAKDAPHVQIERRPGGWAIFLHPLGASDPSGYVYFLDNGLSYIVPQDPCGTTPQIMVLEFGDKVRHLDEPAADAIGLTLEPCESCGSDIEAALDYGDEDCPSCGASVRQLMEIKRLSLIQHRAAIEFIKRDPESESPEGAPLDE